MSELRLDVTVLGNDRSGTGYAPTEFGTFDPESLVEVGHDAVGLNNPAGLLQVGVWDDDGGCEGSQPKKLARPGNQFPMELEIISKMIQETRRIFRATLNLLPGQGILTRFDELEADFITATPLS